MSKTEEKILEWVVKDYFTPNIKAEVILDTLLSEYIEEIVSGQMKEGIIKGELSFLTKEMSIQDKGKEDKGDNRGAKIDYVLEDNEFVYLVELKTSKGSIDHKQVKRYIKNFSGKTAKTFGEALGNKLLDIMEKQYSSSGSWTLDTLLNAFKKTINDDGEGHYADKARNYLKENNRDSTYKYLYTVGQLLDRHSKDMPNLWKKQLRLVYLTPDGAGIFPEESKKKGKQKQGEATQEWTELYIGPTDIDSSISLKDSVSLLEKIADSGDEYAQLLAEIIKAIYLPEKETK